MASNLVCYTLTHFQKKWWFFLGEEIKDASFEVDVVRDRNVGGKTRPLNEGDEKMSEEEKEEKEQEEE
ncbi:hypothetical protein EDD11_008819 [Mortierella claussenii]|nr:hypothetical protein EDD11_008819 [Mortierella claussenii]